MMSRRLARRAPNAVTLGACLLGVACTPDPSSSAEQGATVAKADEPQPAPQPVEQPSAEADGAPEQPAADETGGTEETETGGSEALEPPPLESVPPPPDYGVFKFPKPAPPEEQLTSFAAAGYEVVAVYAGPSKNEEHVGFLRIGARLRAGEKVVNDDCPRGWYALEGGGYACASRGLMVDSKPPFMSYEPKPPRVDQPFPYDWAYVRQWNTPQWWQVPSTEQLLATRELRAVRESERTGIPLPSEQPAGGGGGGEGEGGEGGGGEGTAPLPAPDGEGGGESGEAAAPPEPAPPPEPPPAPPEPPPEPPEPEEEKEPVNIPFSPSMPWLEKGYFLSLGETVRDGDRSYWRTARGGVVEKGMAHPYEPRDFHGAALPPGVTFPVGFVMVKNGTKLLTLGKDNKLHGTGKNLDKRTFLDLGEEVEISGHAYFTVLPYPPPEPGTDTDGTDGEEPELLVKADVMRTPDLQPIPKGLDPWDHWIDVDVTKQMLVAYEGSRPVYVTLVSTGKKGSDEEPFDTPTGRFRVRSKQITSNMDGATATDGNYAIQDVPWVMYFQGSYALHGAFWHESFGYVRSHGCVNLGPTDARWLFFWTTPYLPEHWHGVSASDNNPGTTVVIRKSTPTSQD